MASQQEDSEPDSYAYSKTDPYSGSISYLEWSTYWFWFSHSSSDSYSNSDSDLHLESYPDSDSDLHTEQSDQGQPTPSSSKDPGMSDGNVDNKMSSSTKKPSSYATFSGIPSTAEPALSRVSTRTSSEGSYQPKSTAALTVAIPSVAAIFVLLLFVCFILLWKKTHNGNRSELDSAKSGIKGLEKVKEVQKFRGQTPVEMSVISWNHYTHSGSDGERKDDAQYAEREETSQPIANGNSPRGEEVFSFANYKDNAQGTHEYEEANIPGTQITDVVTGPFCQTLNSAYLSDSNAPLSARNQDGRYDSLDGQQNPKQLKLKKDSAYDETKRIGKGDAKVEFGNQSYNDYLALSRSSANTSEYDKLDKTRRSYEDENISPNEYNVLQPQTEN